MTNDKNKSNQSSKDSDNFFIIDSALLPLIAKAENGCLLSQSKLAKAFCSGIGARKNEKLARKYEKLMYLTTDDNRVKLAALWNPAIRQHERGDFDGMVKQFHIAIDFMQDNIPMEKWDFSLFRIMEELTKSGE